MSKKRISDSDSKCLTLRRVRAGSIEGNRKKASVAGILRAQRGVSLNTEPNSNVQAAVMSLDYSKFIKGIERGDRYDAIGISKDDSGFRVQTESRTYVRVSVPLLPYREFPEHLTHGPYTYETPKRNMVKLMH